jgi:hypothetical protein
LLHLNDFYIDWNTFKPTITGTRTDIHLAHTSIISTLTGDGISGFGFGLTYGVGVSGFT